MDYSNSPEIWAAPAQGLPVRGLYMLLTPQGRVPGIIFVNDEAAHDAAVRLRTLKLTDAELEGLLGSPTQLQSVLQQLLGDFPNSIVPSEVTQLLEILDAIGWSQAKLARKLQVDPNTVSRWVTGRCPVPPWVLEYLSALKAVKDLANALDLS